MRGKHVAALVLALLVALMLALPATAQPDVDTRYKGRIAEAGFFSVKGCVGTEVFVSAQDPRKRMGSSSTPSEASVSIFKYDACGPEPGPGAPGESDGQPLMAAFGMARLAEDDFVIDKKLCTASLDARVRMRDEVSGDSLVANIDLSWRATGDLAHFKESSSFETTGFSFSGRVKGKSRPARASGSVHTGTTNHAVGGSDLARLLSISSRFKQSGQPPEGESFPGIGGPEGGGP